jgi:uncharacterized protein
LIEFEWDRDNLQHIAEHNISPDEVEFVLNGFTLDLGYQDAYDDEERFGEVGVTASGRFLIVITTWRDWRLRVVTAFDATKDLVQEYLNVRGL